MDAELRRIRQQAKVVAWISRRFIAAANFFVNWHTVLANREIAILRAQLNETRQAHEPV